MDAGEEEYLCSTSDAIAQLPAHLAEAAKIYDRGEAEWPRELAEDAIRALIASGSTVNVLEFARYEDGQLVEMNPISTYEGYSAADNLRCVLPAVPSLMKMTGHITAVICWYVD